MQNNLNLLTVKKTASSISTVYTVFLTKHCMLVFASDNSAIFLYHENGHHQELEPISVNPIHNILVTNFYYALANIWHAILNQIK